MTQIDYKPNRVRTVMLVLASLAMLGGAFAVYVMVQPPPGPEKVRDKASLAPAARPQGDPGGPIPPAEGAWVRMYDPNERLTMQFRGKRFTPRDENTIHVTAPEVFFFLGNDQLLRVTGKDGVMAMQEARGGGGGPLKGASARVPTRGKLHEVKVELFEKDAAARVQREEPAEPTLTATLDNAAFDNETYRIATESFVSEGKTFAGDQVPVVVRGADYEFEGQGLTVFWNDRDRRLESLEVSHGKRMVLRNAGDLDASLNRAKTPKAPKPAAQAPVGQAPAAPASAQGSGAPLPTPPARPPTYRAAFVQDVRITQGQSMMARGDTLAIDFQPKGGGAEKSGPRQAPAPEPAPASTPVPTTSATRSAPIVVEWTGKLTIKPVELPPAEAVAEGEAALRLTGRPVVVRQQEAQLEGPELRYRTQDGVLTLAGSAQSPVKMSDPKGGSVGAESLEFRQHEHVALLRGKGYAVQPIVRDGEAAESLDVTWTRSCELRFAPTGNMTMQMERAVIDGDVEVKHPQLNLRSGQLELLFGPGRPEERRAGPAGESPLGSADVTRIMAAGPVWCELTDQHGKKQLIECDDRLEVQMGRADKQLYPKSVDAVGKVRASGDGQGMRADRLHAELKPSTRPAGGGPNDGAEAAAPVMLDSFLATGDVQLTGKDDAAASGAELRASQTSQGMQIVLTGAPAKVSDPKNRLEGPRIVYRPRAGWAAVQGKGTMQVAQQTKGGKAVPPMVVTWEEGVTVDAVAGQADVTGNVVASSVDATGAVNTARGGHVALTLVDKPKADGRDKPKAGGAQKEPADGILTGQMDVLTDKTVSAVKFDQEAVVESTLTAADGTLQRRLYLKAGKVVYSLAEERLEVPGEGGLLAEDHSELAAKANAKENLGRGTTAMAWGEKLTFDRKQQTAQASGDVLISHLPEGADDGDRVQLKAQRVTATFEPDGGPSAATGPASRPAGDDVLAAKLRLRSAVAEGSVRVEGRGQKMENARRAEYDPAAGTVRVRGTPEQPVVVESDKGRVSWVEAEYNLKTGHVKMVDVDGRGGR